MNDFGLLIGKFTTALPTLASGQVSEVQLDANGRLIISGRYLEDSAHASGDAGIQILAVRRDADTSLVDADGDYAPLQVTAAGRLKVDAELDVDFDYVYPEDSAHASGDLGAFVLAVRQDTLATSTSADGDYAAIKTTDLGEVYVKDVSANSSLDTIEAEITALSQLEDSAHTSGDAGIMSLAVRNDSETSLVSANGDYAPFQVNALGRLKVTAAIDASGTESYTVTDGLAAAGDGLETITAAATPWITVASLSVAAGTSAYVYGWQWACDQNAQARIVTDDATDVIVYKTDINSSSTPGTSEHFSESGRVEIPGSATLEVQLQIKKRSATGGNANGTGSLHIRIN